MEAFDAGEMGDRRLAVHCTDIDALSVGDSISVSGVCLTVTEFSPEGFLADVSAETLSVTTLGRLAPGATVNLEPSLRLQTGLGGHLVSGHVDGVGTLVERHVEARSVRMRFAFPPGLARYLAVKGSVCVDGISLTVNDVDDAGFGVNIIPHTLEVTTLGSLQPSEPVNLEVDQVARYIERLLEQRCRAD